MTQQHPITPPLELVKQWDREWREQQNAPVIGWSANLLAYVAARAAQWGADAELEACCEWLGCGWKDIELVDKLRSARRPKPPSLKEKGMTSLDNVIDCIKSLVPGASVDGEDIRNIRRALEQLPDHE